VVEINKKKAQQSILGIVGLVILLQAMGLANTPYVYWPALVLFTLSGLYLTYRVITTKGLSVLGFFSYLFLFIVITVQYMGYTGELKGAEYLLLSAIFTGLTLGILTIARWIDFK
jgi:hypothetical protein